MAEYKQSAAELARELDEQEAASKAIEKQLKELQKAYDEALAINGVLVLSWPLDTFHESDGFGMRFHPILKQWRLHTGRDMAAPQGTPVHAAAAGTVFYADWMSGYGNTVIILHGNGISTLYGHMSAISVQPNQHVSKGQIVGKVGSTGQSTGPHLHFEVRYDGSPGNPVNYVGKLVK